MDVEETISGRHVGSVLLILSVPVAAWWLIGDLSESAGDYFMLRPLTIEVGSEPMFGVLAGIAAIVGAALVLRGRSLLRLAPTLWEQALLLTVGAEVGIAFVYRVFTAGVVGANIGGGMMLLMGVPLVAFMLALAIKSPHSGAIVVTGDTGVATFAVSLGHFVLGMLSLWLSLTLLAGVVAVATVRLWRASPSPAV